MKTLVTSICELNLPFKIYFLKSDGNYYFLISEKGPYIFE